jgi:hypothetical protein
MGTKKVLATDERSKGLLYDGLTQYSQTSWVYPIGINDVYTLSFIVTVKSISGGDNVIISQHGIFPNPNWFAGIDVRINPLNLGFTIDIVHHSNVNSVNSFIKTNELAFNTQYIVTISRADYTSIGTKIFVNRALNVGIVNSNLTGVEDTTSNENWQLGAWFNYSFANVILKDFKFFDTNLSDTNCMYLQNNENQPNNSFVANMLVSYEFENSEGFIITEKVSGFDAILTNYSLANTTKGIANNWRYADETPYTGSRTKVLPKLIEYNLGEGIVFDGISNYLQGNESLSSYSFIHTTNIYGLSMIVKPNDYLQINKGILGNTDTSLENGFFVLIDDGSLWIAVNISDALSHVVKAVGFFTDNDLVHIAITGNGSGVNFYKNGSPFTNIQIIGTIGVNGVGNSTRTLRVGNLNSGLFNYYFNGVLFDVKIFDKTLTQKEVKEDYDSNGQNILPTAINNLVAWCPFKEQQGFVIQDESANNFDNTATNYSLADVSVGVNSKRVYYDMGNSTINPILQI